MDAGRRVSRSGPGCVRLLLLKSVIFCFAVRAFSSDPRRRGWGTARWGAHDLIGDPVRLTFERIVR
jgi:hypothetical protein